MKAVVTITAFFMRQRKSRFVQSNSTSLKGNAKKETRKGNVFGANRSFWRNGQYKHQAQASELLTRWFTIVGRVLNPERTVNERLPLKKKRGTCCKFNAGSWPHWWTKITIEKMFGADRWSEAHSNHCLICNTHGNSHVRWSVCRQKTIQTRGSTSHPGKAPAMRRSHWGRLGQSSPCPSHVWGPIHRPTKLYDRSTIRICDVTFVFWITDNSVGTLKPRVTVDTSQSGMEVPISVLLDDSVAAPSQVMSEFDAPSHHARSHNHVSAAEKLAALTKITRSRLHHSQESWRPPGTARF